MSIPRKVVRWWRREYRFEDYDVKTGHTREGLSYASTLRAPANVTQRRGRSKRRRLD